MLFNSIDFAIFLPIVFLLHWYLAKNNRRAQNALLLISSYIFYGWWDWRFLGLILFSTVVDFWVGQRLQQTVAIQKRKILLGISIAVNLGFLGFFKYYNFFIENFAEAFSVFGIALNTNSLNIILPVGISFYTFQTLSYSIDVYRKKMTATNDFVAFASFVSFFPQLVAGPIERATHLLPQFAHARKFNPSYAVDGLRQILWGLFKKVVIADNCAEYANLIFNNAGEYSGSTLVLGAVFFTFQIYGDFSGYSDIAIGTARLFGVDLKQNFAYPYFSRDIAEFWRRWHISLSTWFRDYVYIPLGGSRGGTWMKVRNTFIIFLVSGFWHGANWTFIVWGFLNALFFLPLLLAKRNRNHLDVVAANRLLPSAKEMGQMTMTFFLCVFAWIFFRAENLGDAWLIISSICSNSMFTIPYFPGIGGINTLLILLLIFLLVEWIGRQTPFAIAKIGRSWPKFWRWTFYYSIAMTIILYGGAKQEFIYFQF